ncbi:hypothetical protein GCM10009780_08370 [Actinomadura alba]
MRELGDLEALLAKGAAGEVRLTDDGELIIPPLTAEDIPAEADVLRTELAAMLPRLPLASVLVEVDARTGFTDHLVHASGKVNRPAELKRYLMYVIIAEATNMGLTAMAESCGVPYDVLAWTAEWYFRPETLEAANAANADYHRRLPLTQTFGTGTLSSSDGQRFPVKGKSITARHLSRYFARGQASPPTPTSPTSTPPTTPKSSSRPPRSRTTCWTGSSATRRTCRYTSTPPTRTARRWRTSPCLIWSASSCRRGSAISGRSPCTGPGARRTSRTGIRGSGRC